MPVKQLVAAKCINDYRHLTIFLSFHDNFFFKPSSLADGVGNFTFEMDMFKDPEYDIVVNQYPVTVQTGQAMYFKVNVKSRDRSLLTFLEECWVTPTPDPSDKTKHILIKQG